LIGGLVTLLPSHSTVVEIVETVPVDAEVMNACQRLKEAGYLIALDDFVSDDPREPLAEIADILKVDLRLTTLEQRGVGKEAWPLALPHAGGKSGEPR